MGAQPVDAFILLRRAESLLDRTRIRFASPQRPAWDWRRAGCGDEECGRSGVAQWETRPDVRAFALEPVALRAPYRRSGESGEGGAGWNFVEGRECEHGGN